MSGREPRSLDSGPACGELCKELRGNHHTSSRIPDQTKSLLEDVKFQSDFGAPELSLSRGRLNNGLQGGETARCTHHRMSHLLRIQPISLWQQRAKANDTAYAKWWKTKKRRFPGPSIFTTFSLSHARPFGAFSSPFANSFGMI